MATAAARARAIGMLVSIVAVVLGSLAHAPGAAAQEDCPLLDPNCEVTSTTGSTTTSTESPTTTEDTRAEQTTTTTGGRDDAEEGDVDDERPSQRAPVETTSATVTVTTLTDVLIPGDGTEGAESTTTTSPRLASADSGLSDEQLILVIVAGLVLVAVVGGVLTWRYWDATRPTVGGR